MRYRLTESTKLKRAQVFTPPELARRTAELLSGDGGAWLELGSGNGRLAQACLDTKNPSSYIGVEIDRRLLGESPRNARATFLEGDVLSPKKLSKLLGNQKFSRTIGNPPYGLEALNLDCQVRIAELCPGVEQVTNWVQLDLYFILESLTRLSRPGEAAFIVAAPIAEDRRLTAFRQTLMQSASEIECYELPADIFGAKTEVQSFLLVARFGGTKLKHVKLGRMSGIGLDVVEERWIKPNQAANRLDFSFYEFQELHTALRRKSGGLTMEDLGVSIVRGSRTKAQFDELGIEYFHTSDFPRQGTEVRFTRDQDYGFQSAGESDILLPRVGTRCMDRQAIVIKGLRHYTEAVYRVRVPARHRALVSSWIFSEFGNKWRQAAAKGSCAKHITVAALMGMPVLAHS